MRKTRVWAGLRLSVASLGLCTAMGRGLVADSIDSTATANDAEVLAATTSTPAPAPLKVETTFATSGSIGTTGITGPNVISFVPESGGTINTPSAFSLGTFVVGYLPPGAMTTYDHTPFSITYTAQKVNGVEPGPGDAPVTITGILNGTVTGPSQSDVVATFNPISKPSFLAGDYLSTLTVLDPQVSLVPSTTNFGRTTAQGHLKVTAAPVPEPTAVALFLTTIAGLGLRRRFGRKGDA